jgi:OFA family oxalate/formate antiporter-like MFS transporter
MGGYGIGLTNMVPTAVLIRWFPDKKGFVTGLATMTLAFGTFFLGSKLSGILVGAYGWSVTFKVISGLFLVVVAGGGLLLRFPPIGYALPSPTSIVQIEMWGYSRGNMIKSSACWLICLWLLCMHLGGLMVFGHVVPFAVEQGVSMSNAVLAMGCYAISNGLGRLLFGWLHDRLGLRPSMILDGIFMSTGLASLVFLSALFGFPGILVAVCLVAMGYGGSIPLLAMSANNFFGPKFFPKNYGFFGLPGAMVGGLFGPVIGGYIQTMTGSYSIAILSAAALAVFGIFVAAILKQPPRHTDDV